MRVLRWFLVLPSALAAGALVNFLVILIHLFTQAMAGRVSRFDAFFAGIAASGSAGFAFVAAGALIAPANRGIVGGILIGISGALAVVWAMVAATGVAELLSALAWIVGTFFGLRTAMED